ncbi:MAG: hypothetical protein ABIV43_02100, partial [Candidatus Saccharimonadales bacterium]
MKNIDFHQPLTRAVLVVTALAALVTGVTYAALTSRQVVLTSNTITTAIAQLKVSKDNSTYADTLEGYAFYNLVPGGNPVPSDGGFPIYLQNVGTVALAARLSVDPTLTNTDGVDLSKVHVIFTPYGGASPQTMTLQELIDAHDSGGVALTVGGLNHINSSGNGGVMVQIQLDDEAFSGSGATINNLNF